MFSIVLLKDFVILSANHFGHGVSRLTVYRVCWGYIFGQRIEMFSTESGVLADVICFGRHKRAIENMGYFARKLQKMGCCLGTRVYIICDGVNQRCVK